MLAKYIYIIILDVFGISNWQIHVEMSCLRDFHQKRKRSRHSKTTQ